MLSSLHRWLGVSLAILALVAAFTGVLLLWSDEYYQWRYPALAQAHPQSSVHAVAIEQTLAAARVPVKTLVMPTEGKPAFHLYLADGSQALHAPGDGALIAQWDALDTLPSFLFEAHVRLFAGEVGHTITGIAGLLLLLMLVTGLLVWGPRRRVFRLRRAWPRKASAPMLLNAHAAQGVLASAVLAMLFLTGSAIVFHEPVERLVGLLSASEAVTRPTVLAVTGASGNVNWRSVLATAKSEFTTAQLRMVSLPDGPGLPVVLRFKMPSELHPNGRSYLVLHPDNGRVLERIDATKTGMGPAAYNLLYPLHAGKTGWPGYRLLLALAGLVLMFQVTTASWVFIRRKWKKG